MYYILFAVLALVSLLVFGLMKWKRKYELPDLPLFINHLLKAGMNNGYLVITESNTKRFVQLSKYIDKATFGIELAFPKAEWSLQFYPSFLDLLKKKDIEYTIIEKLDNEDLEFIKIDFRKDSEKAFDLVKDIFIDVFECDDGLKLFLKLHNVSPWDERINSSDHAALGIKDGLKTLKKK